jgi:carbonic anhydrase
MSRKGPLYTAEQAMDLLKLGNDRRLNIIKKNMENPDYGKKYSEQRQKLIEGQNPFAVILSCSDSRFPPEIIFNNREGDLFVVRTAGHVVENDAAGSIEYAVSHLQVPLIVVMGHDKCGAVTAAVNRSDAPGHIFNVIEHIYQSVEEVQDEPGDKVDLTIKRHIANTVLYLKHLEPICKKAFESGTLKIIGARCPIDSYQVEWYL